jgi:hypothetical protein
MHAMLVRKVLLAFEDDVFDLGDPNMRASFQPDVKTWDECRLVVQHWQQSIKTCAQKDLTKEQFDALEAEVLTGHHMNIQFVKALQGYPMQWNMSMLPDLVEVLPDHGFFCYLSLKPSSGGTNSPSKPFVQPTLP